ncbi:MAG: hypothetical protein KJ077_10625 [Anaerolineae bacterium]|nr:hypothetical protein [Anaerolineae bacterium]
MNIKISLYTDPGMLKLWTGFIANKEDDPWTLLLPQPGGIPHFSLRPSREIAADERITALPLLEIKTYTDPDLQKIWAGYVSAPDSSWTLFIPVNGHEPFLSVEPRQPGQDPLPPDLARPDYLNQGGDAS